MTSPTDLVAPSGIHFGPLGDNWVHLCVDMQRMFAEQTEWHAPWMEKVLPEVVRLVEIGPCTHGLHPLHHARTSGGHARCMAPIL